MESQIQKEQFHQGILNLFIFHVSSFDHRNESLEVSPVVSQIFLPGNVLNSPVQDG